MGDDGCGRREADLYDVRGRRLLLVSQFEAWSGLETLTSRKRESSSAMKENRISIRGAREHNLKNVDLDLPRDSLIVMTGLSGSGKSSLAFDAIYAEGQRRYVESLSAYARQFLELMQK